MTKKLLFVFLPMWALGPVLVRSIVIALGWVVVPIAAMAKAVKLDPSRIRFVGSFGSWGTIDEATVRKYDTKIPHWFLCWQGPYSNLYIHWEMFGNLYRFWIGWKIYPADIYGGNYPADYPNGRFGYRSKGAGPVIQLKRVKR
jgi:hypothetical protein